MVKRIYQIIRSLIFSLILVVAGIYAIAYVLLAIPAFQNHLKNVVVSELKALLGSEVEIESIHIYPFSEATVKGLTVFDLEGEKCLQVEEVGAGISVWRLLSEGKIELTYGEVIGLNGKIYQKKEGEPYNIGFIIEALKSKDDNKEKKAFKLDLRNVVLRKSEIHFSRDWMGENHYIGRLNLADITITELNADLEFPVISDKGIDVVLRRLSLQLPGITEIEKIGFAGSFNPSGAEITDLVVELPESRIFIPSVSIPLGDSSDPIALLKEGSHELKVTDSFITPADLSFLFSPLSALTDPLPLHIDLTGNLTAFDVVRFSFGEKSTAGLSFQATVLDPLNKDGMSAEISDFDFYLMHPTIKKFLPDLPSLPEKIKNALENTGDILMKGNFSGFNNPLRAEGELYLNSNIAEVSIDAKLKQSSPKEIEMECEAIIGKLSISDLFPKVPLNDLSGNISFIGSLKDNQPYGKLGVMVDDFVLKGEKYAGLAIDLDRDGDELRGNILMDNQIGYLDSELEAVLDPTMKSGSLEITVKDLNLSEIVDMKAYNGYLLSGKIDLSATGRDINDLTGSLNLKDFNFVEAAQSRQLHLSKLALTASNDNGYRDFNLTSDWIDGNVEGVFHFRDVVSQLKEMAHSVMPAFLPYPQYSDRTANSDMDFEFTIPVDNSLTEFFNLPVRLLVPVNIKGNVNGTSNSASFALDVPFLQQGKDKLIENTRVIVDLNGTTGELSSLIESTIPVKKGELEISIETMANNNRLSTGIKWINTINSSFKGSLNIDTDFFRNELSHSPEITAYIKPSLFSMGSADWTFDPCTVTYSDNSVNVDHLKIWHDEQFVEISGTASPLYSDVVKISLADIDVDYIFDMLAINYVTFGGTATGEVAGHALLSGDMVAETERFKITDFTYNGAFIGDCDVKSRWNNDSKEVEIIADISHKGNRRVYGQGGIWVTKDSLAFHIIADKVPVDFVQPFMSAFSSHVGGFATGDVNLFGTFKDIDMTGRIFADSVAVRLDYTNTVYHGSDSVILNPGHIEIPSFKLYDKFGNSAVLSGELTHRYFHDPAFNFRLSDASNFLCYDTNADINPDWFGVLFGNGSALVQGVPGLTDISADMTITGNSSFTFVLNDRQYARDYEFLTFSDRRKEARLALENKPEDFKAMFKKKVAEQSAGISKFGIDIRASVTPQVLFTLVMDPAAGDKITARGRGAMQVKYESDNDEMQLYGKYEIDDGNYNFSLQDIILRDFKIKEGSFISFNGNPLAADLDISATYRVNTNLSDLDKSFSTDRDLTRTNVPVDAVLSVNGNMQQPDITFDIELPTLTQDVERKVKSIISTDDMMNRQIIYLLALNRFYTPEYMGSSGNGGELAAVASSTISSQLSNMLGQLTDKVTVAPSFRSDKGDFSDIEVDVALSSRLLNNRLLINGNFGYRDKSNSSTTFVGDFDVEYLLSRNGNFRLKAYNHFNDQNYYLREALTTQGLGVVFRRDFDTLFPFLKKKKKENEPSDSINQIHSEIK